jgi:hypothetical protein
VTTTTGTTAADTAPAEMDTHFQEATADRRVASVPLSHLSIELGHLYFEDYAAGPDRLREHFALVAPWVQAARSARTGVTERTARVSTCFLIDDYFTSFASPREVLPVLLDAARHANLDIDYLVRESACAVADEVELAAIVAGRLNAVPPPGSTGARPTVQDIGWLCNGQRSPMDAVGTGIEAMRHGEWAPPMEIGARNHSVFVDIELWRDGARDGGGEHGGRQWSCAFLAAVWQLLRLGLLRNDGEAVAEPRAVEEAEFPDSWPSLPPVTRLNPAAAPFFAYRTLSVLPARFLQVEHAVRVILDQVEQKEPVLNQIAQRAAGEGVRLPAEVTHRIDYIFVNEP